MGKWGYFVMIVGIALCFVGLFGASVAGNTPVIPLRVVNFITLPLIGKAADNTVSGSVSARTLYLFAVTPLGVLALVVGDILRRAGRDLNYRRDVRIAQAVEARRITQFETRYPQFEGLMHARPNAIPPSPQVAQPLITQAQRVIHANGSARSMRLSNWRTWNRKQKKPHDAGSCVCVARSDFRSYSFGTGEH